MSLEDEVREYLSEPSNRAKMTAWEDYLNEWGTRRDDSVAFVAGWNGAIKWVNELAREIESEEIKKPDATP